MVMTHQAYYSTCLLFNAYLIRLITFICVWCPNALWSALPFDAPKALALSLPKQRGTQIYYVSLHIAHIYARHSIQLCFDAVSRARIIPVWNLRDVENNMVCSVRIMTLSHILENKLRARAPKGESGISELFSFKFYGRRTPWWNLLSLNSLYINLTRSMLCCFEWVFKSFWRAVSRFERVVVSVPLGSVLMGQRVGKWILFETQLFEKSQDERTRLNI